MIAFYASCALVFWFIASMLCYCTVSFSHEDKIRQATTALLLWLLFSALTAVCVWRMALTWEAM